jgi:glycosyltransferase involved in cell wall biosynthesis
MRIARVLTRLNLGGPARQVLASDPELVRRGHAVRIFAGTPEPGEGDLFDHARALGLDLVRVPGLSRGLSVSGDIRARAALRAALEGFAPDVLHTHASKAGAVGRSAAKGLARTARVHTFHGHVLEGYFPRGVSRGLALIERRLARDTDRVIAVSHATADDLVRLGVVPEEKIVVVPPGIDLAPFDALERGNGALRARIGAGADARIVGVVGRLAEVKRPEWALDVFSLLHERYPALHLAFVGDGELRRFVERRIAALDAPARARVHLLGAVEDMRPVLEDLYAVLSTSRSEGLPVALIEAGAAALPVVATAAGGTSEIVAHERTGFLGSNVDELAFSLAQLLDSPDLARAMGQRARVRVGERHGAEALAGRLERVYRAVVEERRCAS